MSHLPWDLVQQMTQVAREMREVVEERGYRVDLALDQDESFTIDGRSRSQLSRSLISSAFRIGVGRAGLDLDYPKGGSSQFRAEVAGRISLFRLKRAHATGNGYRIVTNSSSTWGELDEDLLIIEEPWVFAYELGTEGLSEIFVAPVLDVVEGKPGYFVLGEVYYLSGEGPQDRGFRSDADDTLPGLEDDDEDRDSDAA
jgi:hypothetical protein